MASSASASRALFIVGGLSALALLAGCATLPEDKAAARSPASLAQQEAKNSPLVDPWATALPPEPSVVRVFKWLRWDSAVKFIQSEEEQEMRASPYRPAAQIMVMKLRNPSDVATIRTVPETVLWAGAGAYGFTKQQVQWQQPPKPAPVAAPPAPPAPPLPSLPPEPVLLDTPQQVSQIIYFAFSKAALSSDAKQALDILPVDNVASVVVDAHTDAIGGDQYNDKLSVKRGKAVADYLALRGIPTPQIEIVAKGKRQPVGDNKTADGRAKNRRAEVLVIVQIKTP